MRERVAAVTGASGYLGSRICAALASAGWDVVQLVRSPGRAHGEACAFDLGAPLGPEVRDLLRRADVLVHAAYDLRLTSEGDIWRINVEGTRRLLMAASDAGVRRILVLSSMSAFDGTEQLYGRAKLDIEAAAEKNGGCAIRPGLVYGENSAGMAGALRKLTRLPLVPLVAGADRLYTVREDDLMRAVVALASAKTLEAGTVSAAHPAPVALRGLMSAFAEQEGRRCRFIGVPWRFVYGALRGAELIGLHPPFRADSLLGLVRTAPKVVNGERLTELGVAVQPFGTPMV